jgi:hypothetical protein
MKKVIKIVAGTFLVLLFAEIFWQWVFCRFYVGPNEMAVITSKNGDPLEPGQILAREGQKGIWEETLGEGRHFLNPVFYEWEINDVILVQGGSCDLQNWRKSSRGRIHRRAWPERDLA